jgi:hypothetical protein
MSSVLVGIPHLELGRAGFEDLSAVIVLAGCYAGLDEVKRLVYWKDVLSG